MLLEEGFKANEISEHLGLTLEQAPVLSALISLVIDCLKYSTKMTSVLKSENNISETSMSHETDKFSDKYFHPLTCRLESNLMILYKAKAIKSIDSDDLRNREKLKGTIKKPIKLINKSDNSVEDMGMCRVNTNLLETEVMKIKNRFLDAVDVEKRTVSCVP